MMLLLLASLLFVQESQPQPPLLNVDVQKLYRTGPISSKFDTGVKFIPRDACKESEEYLASQSDEERLEMERDNARLLEEDGTDYSSRYFATVYNQCLGTDRAGRALNYWNVASFEAPGYLAGYDWHFRYFDAGHWVAATSVVQVSKRTNGALEVRARTRGCSPANSNFNTVLTHEASLDGAEAKRWFELIELADIPRLPPYGVAQDENGNHLPIPVLEEEYVEFFEASGHYLLHRTRGHLKIVGNPLTELLEAVEQHVSKSGIDLFVFPSCQ